jgi:2-polyprenyl-3-methyl-5-hydroxy-6-metoxy-1,4-benzoquinol methylase
MAQRYALAGPARLAGRIGLIQSRAVSAGTRTGFDPIHQSQLLARRVVGLLRRRGAEPDGGAEKTITADARARRFEQGERQLAGLAARIERQTGATLTERVALDFGCGFGRLALPLAEKCQFVYGLDILPNVLERGAEFARERNLTNMEWMDAGRLPELAGRYDLAISHWVFQHIPPREGERIFATIVRGLRPGGVAALHFTVRPEHPWRELLRSFDLRYAYQLVHSYSVNRLARILVREGVNEWAVQWHTSGTQNETRPYPSITLYFRKD